MGVSYAKCQESSSDKSVTSNQVQIRLHRSFEILPKDSDGDEGLGRRERSGFQMEKRPGGGPEQRGVFRKGWWMNRMGLGVQGHEGSCRESTRKGQAGQGGLGLPSEEAGCP